MCKEGCLCRDCVGVWGALEIQKRDAQIDELKKLLAAVTKERDTTNQAFTLLDNACDLGSPLEIGKSQIKGRRLISRSTL